VLAIGDLANTFGSMHMGRMAKRLADKVTIYTDGNGELAEQLRATVANDPAMRIDNRGIQRLSKGHRGAELNITLAGGEVVTEGFAVSSLIFICILSGLELLLKATSLTCRFVSGSQAENRSQRTFCSPARAGVDRSG
jgi:hypothetical protein